MSTIEFDENLISRMAAHDEAAFREIYEKTSSAIYGFALSILGSRQDAEDVMHDAFIRIYTNAGSYVRQGKPLAWMLTIVRNLCYNRIRAAGRYSGAEDCTEMTLADPAVYVENDMLDSMILESALKVLDAEERQIALLHAVTGLRHREIAQIMDMPIGTVLSRYNRALKKLRKELERRGYIK